MKFHPDLINNPSFYYFIKPLIHNFEDSNSIDKVIFVRYLRSYESTIWQNNKSNTILFIDDDLLDWKSLLSLPLPYALRLWWKITSKKNLIHKNKIELWVSNKYLAKKYAIYKPKLLYPIASGELLKRHWKNSILKSSSSHNIIKICYHGTWSHRNEILWLVQIIINVQAQCKNTFFEFIGGFNIFNLFKDIPRVTVLPNMSWPDYIRHTQHNSQNIGLAPLLDTSFNHGRSVIKFFDYARCGAVGIYSKNSIFNDFIDDKVDGFLLENDPTLWANKIIELANEKKQLDKMADAAWNKVLRNSVILNSSKF